MLDEFLCVENVAYLFIQRKKLMKRATHSWLKASLIFFCHECLFLQGKVDCHSCWKEKKMATQRKAFNSEPTMRWASKRLGQRKAHLIRSKISVWLSVQVGIKIQQTDTADISSLLPPALIKRQNPPGGKHSYYNFYPFARPKTHMGERWIQSHDWLATWEKKQERLTIFGFIGNWHPVSGK